MFSAIQWGDMNDNVTISLNSGNEMPIIGFGTWKLTEKTTATIVQALSHGYRMIDTSGDYGTQPDIGKALKASGLDRDEYYIVSKVEETDDAYEATKQDLYELGLDHADLILIHRPPVGHAGIKLWEGLIRAKEDGLTNDIGVSNYDEIEIDELIAETGEVPVVNQIEWSPFGYSTTMLNFCSERGIVIQAYSPLTHGERLDDQRLVEVAQRYNKTPAQILIRWNMQMGTAPLPKANHTDHLKENIDVFDFEITGMDMAQLCALNEEYSALGALPYA